MPCSLKMREEITQIRKRLRDWKEILGRNEIEELKMNYTIEKFLEIVDEDEERYEKGWNESRTQREDTRISRQDVRTDYTKEVEKGARDEIDSEDKMNIENTEIKR